MIKVFHMTIHNFFPELSKWLNQIDDPRVKKNYIYSEPPSMDSNTSVSYKTGFKKTNKISAFYR